ncbi:hypothetical protein MGSAQ_002599, partial [marine sediment metagenome]
FAPTELKLGVHWYHFNQPIIPPFVAVKTGIVFKQQPCFGLFAF